MLSARKRVVALALCVVAAGAVGGVIAAQSDGGGATASASDDGKADVVDSPDESLQACADSWNDGNANKESVASISTAAQAENPTAYVHVGFSSVFPDKCMITVANPSTMYAQQYLQGGGGEWSLAPAWTGSVNDLDGSTLPWNARMAQDGTIIVL
ncbi:hypothetical protein SAVCW2_23960 [Streptomyces avermitilis]|uniref:Secreted protein n=1 Tax=Streptomyces avermitilis TaxID=33903 RepID=A0A4D4MPU1_STRAX|nr:hypothetical protein SAVMC3_62750 [Streptomyces avermitilis]GDY74131.1 hypothetical protein SAV31267_036160 [Streptomyces avermitilis]GDY83197.1 hypothetical protein SAVCW2_23960 [Streptomyces avermitilis]